jgi:hypothetical protein
MSGFVAEFGVEWKVQQQQQQKQKQQHHYHL